MTRAPSPAAELPALAVLALALCLGSWWPLLGTAPPEPTAGAAAPAEAGRPLRAERAASAVDLNAADATDLARLPGIGPVLAQRILAARQTHGPFRSAEELLRVPGFGPARLAAIRPLVRLAEGP